MKAKDMKALDVIRAWKDEAFRNSLSPGQRAMLPENPAGTVESLVTTDLDAVVGAGRNSADCGPPTETCTP